MMAIPNTDIQLIPVELHTLKPTQMTVGYREVSEKHAHWKTLSKKARATRSPPTGSPRCWARSATTTWSTSH
jgi:hypothetical protein